MVVARRRAYFHSPPAGPPGKHGTRRAPGKIEQTPAMDSAPRVSVSAMATTLRSSRSFRSIGDHLCSRVGVGASVVTPVKREDLLAALRRVMATGVIPAD